VQRPTYSDAAPDLNITYAMSISCKNCNTTIESKFCPACGQIATTKRFTTRDLFNDFFQRIFPLEKGFLYSTRRLLSTPGAMLRGYLEGQRANHSKPLHYLFIATAASTLIFKSSFAKQLIENPAIGDPEKVEKSTKIFNFLTSNINLLMVLFIPFIALLSWLFFRKSKYNYAEHLVVNIFVFAAWMLFSIPTAFPYFLGVSITAQRAISTAITLLGLLFCAWAYIGVFQPDNKIVGGIKAVASISLGFIMGIFFFAFTAAPLLAYFFK
jgi:hypothetical protein